jgi:hypothetical protein
VKRGGSLSFLVGTIGNVLVMEIGWTDVGSGGYILVSCAHSNTSYICTGFPSLIHDDHFIAERGDKTLPPLQNYTVTLRSLGLGL